MAISLIAAIAAHRVIGNRGAMPWRLPDDMARFRRLTMGHAVVMGRATFDSIGRPLAGRKNIVLTRDTRLAIAGCQVVHSAEAAAERAGADELFVIGGASVYAQFLPVADRMYLTHIDAEVPGDTWFPEVRWEQWRITRELPGEEAYARPGEPPGAPVLPHRFVDYERIQ